MTFEELNIVRKLKKQLADENKKLCALKIVVGAFPHKYGKSDNSGSAGNFAKSADYESFVLQIADTEKKIENVYNQLSESMSELSKKIETEFTNTSEQILLIYRYVACKPFHEIWFSPITNQEFPMSRHDNEEVKSGTERAIRKQSGVYKKR